MEALKVLKEENLCERSADLGQLLRELLSKGLQNIKAVKEGNMAFLKNFWYLYF
jgi:4-aminobutyrate aminotransferase-like enzyme